MNTVTLLIWVVAVALALLHTLSLLSARPFQRQIALLVYGILGLLSFAFSYMILSDIYPDNPIDKHRIQFFLIMGCLFLATSSIYRLWRNNRSFSVPRPPNPFGFSTVFLRPVASVIQLVASILGIISFYLQFVRTH